MNEFDYSKLKGRITEKFETRSNFANALGRTKSYVSQVLNNKKFLKQVEMQRWAEVLEIDTNDIGIYFFAH